MEVLFLLLLGGVLALFLSNRDLKARVDALERRLDGDAFDLRWAPAPGPPPVPEPAEPRQPTAPAARGEEWIGEALEEAEDGTARENFGALFERLVAGRLLIWIGGVALAVAGLLLVRHSIDLITPEGRMIAAALFGLLLLGAGEYARAGRILADDPRIAQALVGAGLAVLYATTYGSHILYGLIGTWAASTVMLAVTAAALVLSLRHGAPTAIMGLIGGFLTPLLVGDPDAGAVPLLAYLALLNVAIFALAWRRGWTWLAAAAVGLSFLWTAFLLPGPRGDAVAAGSFILILSLAAAVIRPGEGRQLGLIQPLAIGLVQLAVLVARTDIGAPAWALFGTLGAASLVLALIRPAYRAAPALALGLALGLLLAKATTGIDPLVPAVAIGITLLFGGAGLALAARESRLLWTAIACAGLVGPAAIVRAARPELLDRPGWGAAFALLALGLALLVWLRRQHARDDWPPDPQMILAGAGAALLSGLAVHDLLPADLTASGWLAIAILVALAARRLGDSALALVASLAAFAAALRSFLMVPDLWGTMVGSLFGEIALASALPPPVDALWALILPAALLVVAWHHLPPLQPRLRRLLIIAAAVFAVSAAYLLFKQLFGLDDRDQFIARGFAERTIITQALFAAGWLLCASRARLPWFGEAQLAAFGTALTAVAAARLIWFDMILHNPADIPQNVGAMPVLNLLLPAYLLSAAWLYAARRGADAAARSGVWIAAFLATLTIGAMLMVRQAFQGPILTGPDMPIAEFYGYSVAGLLVSIGLLTAGIRLPDKALRLAGLAFLTATVVKVFGFDADALDGVWRILSFLMLGVALIGIGRIYGPVLRAESGGRPG